jgi:alpha-1,2-mannosyltransferase
MVYRMGGQHVFGAGLYSSYVTVLGRHLLFTYPPLAALVFWPLSHLSVDVGSIVWDAIDVVALTALIAVSIAAALRRALVPSDWCTALVLLFPLGYLILPVRLDFEFGQINVVLVLMIVADLALGVAWRGRRLPRGMLTGFAAALKLTPLIFLPYLLATRQWRAARNMTLTFIAATGAVFILSPQASWLYFSKDLFEVDRIGNGGAVINQTLRAAMVRAGLSPSHALVDLMIVLVVCGGVWLSAMACRHSSPLLGVLLCGGVGLLVSPISWLHHYVWIVPVLVWLVVGVDRPARGELWAAGTSIVFIAVPPSAVTDSNVLLYLRENAYVIATVLFLALTGALLRTRSRETQTSTCPIAGNEPSAPVVGRGALGFRRRQEETGRPATHR